MSIVGKYEPSEYWKGLMEDIPDEPEPPPFVRVGQMYIYTRTFETHKTEYWTRYWMKKFISYEVDKEHKVGYIIWNRPDKLNAGLPYCASEAAFLARDDPDVKVIVMKGMGRAFGAGYDITPRPDPSEEAMTGPYDEVKSVLPYQKKYQTGVERWVLYHREEQMNEFYRRRFWDNPKPVISAVHGFCLAGATHVCHHVDLVYASEDALFGYPILRQSGGGWGDKAIWPHYWGLRKTKEMLFTGQLVSAKEAYNFGFVNKVLPTREELYDWADKIARSIAVLPLPMVALVKRKVNNYYQGQLGLRSYLDFAEGIDSMGRDEYSKQAPEDQYGSDKWVAERSKKGLSYLLRERDGPFEEIDSWWREKYAARPQFEKGRLEDRWQDIVKKERETGERDEEARGR